ncbi:hypothetical protein [Hymenobacter crusticola]|uniref:Uncharacterized protein n=1 Tax=Hymenobacter crusticola TaxID=1770526 RepID=A0A243WFN5_9BACT|nr:hypothetical protein [Hymenobacter crusticola]OUJ74553.1 hypothetical protein BXP70_07170 [Hymenobacter crusticola]
MTIPPAFELPGEAALPLELLTTLPRIGQSGIMVLRLLYDACGENIINLAWGTSTPPPRRKRPPHFSWCPPVEAFSTVKVNKIPSVVAMLRGV